MIFFKTSWVSTTSIDAVIRLCAQNHHLSVQQPVTKETALLKAPSHIPSGNCPKARAEGPFQHTPHTVLALGFPHPALLGQPLHPHQQRNLIFFTYPGPPARPQQCQACIHLPKQFTCPKGQAGSGFPDNSLLRQQKVRLHLPQSSYKFPFSNNPSRKHRSWLLQLLPHLPNN